MATHAIEKTVEIFIWADLETLPEEDRRFALLSIPRHLFSEATASAARRAANPGSCTRDVMRDFGIGGRVVSCLPEAL